MPIDADLSVTTRDNDTEPTRKAWIKPEILLITLMEDAEGMWINPGDGLSNLS